MPRPLMAACLFPLAAAWQLPAWGTPRRSSSPRMEVTPSLPANQHHFLAINDLSGAQVVVRVRGAAWHGGTAHALPTAVAGA